MVVALLCVRQAPRCRRKASLAEGVQAGQQLGLPAVEAELTQGTDVQQAKAALLFRLGLLDRLALGLVFHDDHDIIRFYRFSVFLHGLKAKDKSVAGYYNFLITVIQLNNKILILVAFSNHMLGPSWKLCLVKKDIVTRCT